MFGLLEARMRITSCKLWSYEVMKYDVTNHDCEMFWLEVSDRRRLLGRCFDQSAEADRRHCIVLEAGIMPCKTADAQSGKELKDWL